MFAKLVGLSTLRYGKPKLDEIAFEYATLEENSLKLDESASIVALGEAKIRELGLTIKGDKQAFSMMLSNPSDRVYIYSEHINDFFFIKTIVISNGHFVLGTLRLVLVSSVAEQMRIDASKQGQSVYMEATISRNNTDVAHFVLPNEPTNTEFSLANSPKFVSRAAINVLKDLVKGQYHGVAKAFVANADLFAI